MTDLPPSPEGSGPYHGFPPADATLPDAAPPGVTPPAYPAPAYPVAPPGYAPPGYAPPGYAPPGYAPPGYAPPGYAPPGYAPPGYQVPGQYYPAPGMPYSAYPTYGYQVPGGSPMYDVTGMGADPLVTPPTQGFAGWWSRLWQTFARSWRSLFPILLLTSVIPSVGFGAFISGPLKIFSTDLQQFQQLQQADPTTPIPSDLAGDIAKIYAILGVYLLVFLLFGAVGWAASMWTITRQAAGEPAPFGRAFVYGLKNLPRVGGWLILYFLAITLASACFLIPGLYVAVAGSLIVPFVIFSRGSLPDSFRMVNKNFGPVLGRVATIYGLTLAVGLVVVLISSVAGSSVSSMSASGFVIFEAVAAILTVPTSMVLVIGIFLTFAEMRAKEMLTTTPMLNQAL